tara:strand:- start:2911 stop:3192 length:282 start_codon:yes stop_codon:yes gene_type:complete
MPTDPFFKFFLLLIFYIIVLITLRYLGFGEKKITKECLNACPKCLSSLHRVERKFSDRLLNHLTFKIFNFKRYKCNSCEWQGLRWEKNFKANP